MSKKSQKFLEVVNLTRTFAESKDASLNVFQDLSFEVEQGKTVAITGLSGSGKSVLLQLLGGLDYPNHGKCFVEGVDIYKFNQKQIAAFRNTTVGYVFQFNQLLADFTAVENVMLPMLIARKNYQEAQKQAHQKIAALGLQNRANTPVNRLSGGEQQRVAIARALINNPKLILADEPTGNLDYQTSLGVVDNLLELVNHAQSTLVLVTHNLELAKLMNINYELNHGKLVRLN